MMESMKEAWTSDRLRALQAHESTIQPDVTRCMAASGVATPARVKALVIDGVCV